MIYIQPVQREHRYRIFMATQFKHTKCECGDVRHQLTWEYESGVERSNINGVRKIQFPPSLYVTVYLSQYLPWYKRFWLGILYIIGIEPTLRNQFDCTCISIEEARKIKDILEIFERNYENFYEMNDELKNK